VVHFCMLLYQKLRNGESKRDKELSGMQDFCYN